MGELVEQFKSCKWLGEGRCDLYHLLDSIEDWIDNHKGNPRPSKSKMLLCFARLTKIPKLIIVGQDPYPDKKATGIAFQTAENSWSSSLDCIAKNLGYKKGFYPDLDFWVDEQGVLLMNAALCNFGRCGKSELFQRWHDFVFRSICLLHTLNPNVVVMLLGKKRVWSLLTGSDISADSIVKCYHPSHGGEPTEEDWKKVERKLKERKCLVKLRGSPVPCNVRKSVNVTS